MKNPFNLNHLRQGILRLICLIGGFKHTVRKENISIIYEFR
jgi:hypothetical protein